VRAGRGRNRPGGQWGRADRCRRAGLAQNWWLYQGLSGAPVRV